jgi:prolyl oligopeptidase
MRLAITTSWRAMLAAGALWATASAHGDGEALAGQARLVYPPALASPEVEIHHGRSVPDPYRWLEDLASTRVRAWAAAQDRLAVSWIDAADGRARLEARISAVTEAERYGVPVQAADRLFFTQAPAGQAQPRLVMTSGDAGEGVVLVDAAAWPGETLAGFWPSPDGRHVAYGRARAGSSWYRLEILEVEGKRTLPDTARGLHGGGSLSWAADGSGFYYAAYDEPAPGAEQEARRQGQRVLFHRLGDPGPDRWTFARPDAPDARITPVASADGRYVVFAANDGPAGPTRVAYLDLRSPGGPVPLFEADASYTFLGTDGDRLLFLTTRGAPRGRVVAVDPRRPQTAHWEERLPERADPLYFANVVSDRLVAVFLRDARHAVEVFDIAGRPQGAVALPDVGTTFSGFVGRRQDPWAFFSFNNPSHPGSASLFRLDPRTREVVRFFHPALPFAPEAFVTSQVFYRSADGTRVPMFLSHRRDVRPDGRRPVVLYAYGAFGWAATPWFQPQVLAFMERGGVYALANVRGGGEYGEAWHRAAVGRSKQRAIDDYLAAADWLVAQGWTSPARLVASGGSASGPLAAAAVMQRPASFGAALVDIPILDMLRYERFTGAGYWRDEFGTAQDPEDFAALAGYSPYHNVRPGTCYPPTLVTAGEKDETAVPSHAYKFVAALQAAQGCANPVLLQVVWGGGHGYGTTPAQSALTYARQLAFLARALGEDGAGEPPPSPPAAACAGPEHRSFDFWVGEWTVTDAAGKAAGRSRVEKVLGGCALLERWTGTDGFEGQAFHLFDRVSGRWQQRWVDSRGQMLELPGGFVDGTLRYEGPWRTREGRPTLARMEFSRLPEGRVRQRWQQSVDGGTTWRTDFDGVYAPAP